MQGNPELPSPLFNALAGRWAPWGCEYEADSDAGEWQVVNLLIDAGARDPAAVAVAQAIVQRLREQQLSPVFLPDEELVARMMRVLDARHTDKSAVAAAHAYLTPMDMHHLSDNVLSSQLKVLDC